MQKGLTELAEPFLRGKGWTGSANSFVTWWRRTHYENSMIDALCDRGHTPYRQIGHRAVSQVMDRCGFSYTQDDVRSLVAGIEALKPFPDIVPALHRLRFAGLPVGDPVERRPRHAGSRRSAYRLSVRLRHFGPGGRIFQATLEDLREGGRTDRSRPVGLSVRRQLRVRLHWCEVVWNAHGIHRPPPPAIRGNATSAGPDCPRFRRTRRRDDRRWGDA